MKNFNIQHGSGGAMQNSSSFAALAATDTCMGEGEWYWMTLPSKSVPGGTPPTRTAITDFQISVGDDNTAYPVTVHIQALAAVWTIGCVTFNFDDESAPHYNIPPANTQQVRGRRRSYPCRKPSTRQGA
ncbi:hypothetical protein J7I84_21255 [Arthrobacter sp. ISL-85]|nr:hypothetical protein [Arthrobacter sp. ISL-85]